MNKEFSRMQKLAGLITENMEGKNLNSIADNIYNYIIGKPMPKSMPEPTDEDRLSTSTSRREYIKSLGLFPEDEETVMMKVTAALRDDAGDTMDEGVASMGKKAGEKKMGMEEGLNRRVHEMKLRDKIREMILAEMGGDIAEAKEKDKEEDVDVTADVDITDDEMMGNNDPNVTEIQDLLIQLQKAAKELGDEKLLTQIDNTITFFTREHIATADNME
ncbi:hypothetical protein UFOVP331_184 [uncultured Caudovirales phage]|uniref:Uncharacterized protein n=1 Tax=uncultured Caudovirales phage TaxID=2100421 RepID=A0A6J5LVK6_9CAUD|nr:hypothetical protein UFOVP331_184 [uncultured Caudovirales phage]